MAKKSSTINAEEFVWKMIDDYMKENNIASRNTAIECIFSEYKILSRTPYQTTTSKPTQSNLVGDACDRDDLVDIAISNQFNNMPD